MSDDPRLVTTLLFMLDKLVAKMPTLTLVSDPRDPIAAGQARWVADVKRFVNFALLPAPLVLVAYNGAQSKDAGENKTQGGSVRRLGGQFSVFLFSPNMGPIGDGESNVLQMLDDAYDALESEVVFINGRPTSKLYWQNERRYDIYTNSVCFEQFYDNDFVRTKVLSE